MLITGYDENRDSVISSIEKFLTECEKNGTISSGTLEESGGMGSYETLYITFTVYENTDKEESYTIRFSGHSGSYSNPDFSIWNDDIKTIDELKVAITNCFKEALEC